MVNTGEDSGEEELDGTETEVGLDGEGGRVGALLISDDTRKGNWTYLDTVHPHAVEERSKVIERRRVDELAIIVPQADEEVVW